MGCGAFVDGWCLNKIATELELLVTTSSVFTLRLEHAYVMASIAMLSALTDGCEFKLFVPDVTSALARVEIGWYIEGAVQGMFVCWIAMSNKTVASLHISVCTHDW